MPTVVRVLVPRYRASRQVCDLCHGHYGELYEQHKDFAKIRDAYEWVAWGFIFRRRRGDCECDGKFGRCCAKVWKPENDDPDDKPRCRYHRHDYCRKVVPRLARWLRWRDRRGAEA